MQFSTDEDDDEEEFEEVVGDVETTLGQGESLSRSSQSVKYKPGKHISMETKQDTHKKACVGLIYLNTSSGSNEEDNKQAAEAMVQLGGVGFYNQHGMALRFFREKLLRRDSINVLFLFYPSIYGVPRRIIGSGSKL